MLFRICAALAVMSLLTACAKTTASGDAGCGSYAEARGTMPDDPEALPEGWLKWLSETDTRMTATCRGKEKR